jgi:hypothetical protein
MLLVLAKWTNEQSMTTERFSRRFVERFMFRMFYNDSVERCVTECMKGGLIF